METKTKLYRRQTLDMYLREKAAADYQPMKIGDLGPEQRECGEAAVVNEEGCRKCYACGYSEC